MNGTNTQDLAEWLEHHALYVVESPHSLLRALRNVRPGPDTDFADWLNALLKHPDVPMDALAALALRTGLTLLSDLREWQNAG